ncbi:peptidase [Candidatus Micrarchaeota archaeon CG1_02_51_15]|nr:MAG: peptidase [Candidatus Micrarchaeota archaeon CG1_02_51_15]
MEYELSEYSSFESTKELSLPKDPLQQIIGQSEAVRVAKLAALQRRNILLVGPPGTGKSLLAQSIAFHLPQAREEISVLHNPEAPERPLVEVRTAEKIFEEKKQAETRGKMLSPEELPFFVAEKMGFRCRRCNRLSAAAQSACPNCGALKYSSAPNDFLSPYFSESPRHDRVHTTKITDGREEIIVYERVGEKARVLDQAAMEKLDALRKTKPRRILVPLARKTFIQVTGASETEVLGDVRHDPYGGHAQIGTLPYLRVVPGAVHEAHEGVLFVDELSALNNIQRNLLTAMQEKKYAIAGRNSQSAGSSVRVDGVPCDFILVAASNINDLPYIFPALRSRIIGNGYEILLETSMPDSQENRAALAQFTAQEITKDGRIPHATAAAVEALANEARKRAQLLDRADNSLTLRLRELSGIIRLAGDLAVSEGAELIEEKHVTAASEQSRNVEQKLRDKYGSVWKAGAAESALDARPSAQKEVS